MRFFRLVVIFILFGALMGGVPVVHAAVSDDIQVLNQEIAKRKDKIKELEGTIEKYKQNIAENQTQAVSLKNQMGILDNNVQSLKLKIEATNQKIEATELEIKQLGLQIGEKAKSIERQKKIIAKMVTNIHANDQKTFLEIALTYNDFADFYTELKYTENIYIDLGRAEKALRLSKEDLETKKQQVETKRAEYKRLLEEYENNKGQLTEQIAYKQLLLSQTKSKEAKFQTLLSSLKQQYQVIENEERTFEAQVRKKLEEQDKIQASGDVLMSWPVPSRVINAEFHDATYPFKNVFQHSGIDIRASHGTVVRAAASGYIARARRCSTASCYSYVLIVHTGALSSLYGHLSSISVADDQFVNRGDVIGYSGGTPGTVGAGPFVTGPHLHFEARLNGIPVNPMPYLVQ